MDIATYIPAFVTLFVVIDPIGLAPLFVALTAGTDAARRRSIAIRSCLVAFALLTLFGLAGEAVLNFLGISMPAFRMAGGILLFLTALDMLFERRTERRQGQADAEPDNTDPSVFPLAIPLISGPGAIASMILLTGQDGSVAHIAAVHGVMALVVACVFALFLLAAPLERLLGPTGINVVTRLLGMLLAALSVQFVIDGLRDLQVV
ncbi:MarC family protein [Hasllibacter sp. MH4015]|uniref:MarC family protein n=1 Tax=Hasllibacter sp. MH4015 TaxID=2854029 RepID=UPI001CD47EF0|nr:MarC family protein [Hasllibacter sp. MH4015]